MSASRLAHEFAFRGPIRRILVQRPRALGDVLLITPALRALRAGYPDAALDVAVDPALEPLLRHNPHVDRVWTYAPAGAPLADRWRFMQRIRAARFDLVIDLHGTPRTALVAWRSGAANRVGYALRGRGRMYNFRVQRDTDRSGRRRSLYAAQMNLEIVARCGVRGPSLEDTRLVFVAAPGASRQSARRRPADARRQIGVAPAGTWQAKTYPLEAFARAADQLARDADVLVLWGPGERGLAERMLDAMHEPAQLAPETNLEQLGALLQRLDLLVANDSGVKHLAVACGTPTLTLFGPTRPMAWMPFDGPHVALRSRVPCLECNLTRCAHHLCMRTLRPDWVAEAALRQLGRAAREAGS